MKHIPTYVPFLANQPKRFNYFKNFTIAKCLFIYTADSDHIVLFEMYFQVLKISAI